MSAPLTSARRAVQPRHRRRGHDVHDEEAHAGQDLTQEDADEAGEQDEEGDEHDEPAKDAAPPSLPKLAAAIRDAHQRCQQLRGRATEEALKLGRLLLEARKRVPHGKWLPWLEQKVSMSERAAHRYLRLAKMETKLDDIAPTWRTELWPSQALDLLAQPADRGPVDEQEPADDTPSAETDDDVREDEDAAKHLQQAKLAARERKEARSIYARAVAFRPKFQPTQWRFEPGSDEQEALKRVQQALTRAARSAARPFNCMVNNKSVPPEEQELVVAMRLVEV
jgi:hypothetical protein